MIFGLSGSGLRDSGRSEALEACSDGNDRSSSRADRLQPDPKDARGTRGRFVCQELVLSSFTIVDEQGNRRILLDSKDTPMLALYDEKGTPCAFLGVLKGFAGLSLFDEKGTRRADLLATKGGAMLNLQHEGNAARWPGDV